MTNESSLLSNWDELGLRERQELASALRMGIASPFWTQYRAWLADQFQLAVRGLIPACTDIPSILAAENLKGRLAGISRAMEMPDEFLAQLDASIAADTKETENAGADQPFQPFLDDAPSA